MNNIIQLKTFRDRKIIAGNDINEAAYYLVELVDTNLKLEHLLHEKDDESVELFLEDLHSLSIRAIDLLRNPHLQRLSHHD